MTVAALRDLARAARGREPHLVPLAGAPGDLAVMTTPDSLPGHEAMNAGTGWRNEVAARVLLDVPRYRPGRRARRIHCPLLVCVAERDAVTPPGPARRAAERAPAGELRSYDAGHFDVYTGELWERVVADQLGFLARHLAGGRAGATRGEAGRSGAPAASPSGWTAGAE